MTKVEEVVGLLKEKKAMLATAESCTGGLLAATVVNVSGASECFYGGFVTYANAAKEQMIGVSHKTLEQYGAVSEETAEEMVRGTLLQTGADYAVATTGIAGPSGGTKEKPVGLVYIACGSENHVCVEENHFNGNREDIRKAAVQRGIELLMECMQEA